MNLKSAFKEFRADPFGFFDRINITVMGNNFNIYQKFVRLRKVAFLTALFGLACWIIFGFDSTPLQFLHVIFELPSYFAGQITFQGLVEIYHEFYGKEMHYSAFVIYGFMYWALSQHYDKNLGFTGSKNVAYSTGIVLFSVAIFEFYWIYSFAFFQNQPWVATWKMPQLRILAQNLIFLVFGGFVIFYMWCDSFNIWKEKGEQYYTRLFSFKLNKVAVALIVLSVGSAVFWQQYPLYVEKITVEYETGELWTNTNNFPQTLYTVDVNPEDSFNAGIWFHVENDLIHFVNTLIKIIVTYTLFYIAMLRKHKIVEA